MEFCLPLARSVLSVAGMNGFLRYAILILGFAVGVFFSGCAKKESELLAHLQTSKGLIVVKLFEDKAPKTVENFVGLATGEKTWKTRDGEEKNEPFYDGLIFHRVINDFMIQGGCPEGTGTGGPGYAFEDETYAQGELLTGEIADEGTATFVFETVMLPELRALQVTGGENEPLMTLYQELAEVRSVAPLVGRTVEEVKEVAGRSEPIYGRGELIDRVRFGTLCMANSGPNTNGSQFFIVTKTGGTPWLDGKHTVFGEVIEGIEVADAIQKVETGAQDKPVQDVVIESISIKKIGGSWF